MAELVMPKFGLTMTEGLLTEWAVAVGSEFSRGDVLFSVETEKVVNEVEAEADGVLIEILVPAGETVAVGVALAKIDGEGFTSQPAASKPQQETAKLAMVTKTPNVTAENRLATNTRIIATPLARRIAKIESVDLNKIEGSGLKGRIKAADVRARASQEQAISENASGSNLPRAANAPVSIIEPDTTRKATARRVQLAKQEIPHFYLTAEAEVSELNALRARLNSDSSAARISISHMLIKAIGLALRERPGANRVWSEDKILAFNTEDVGLVVETDNGLRIPVVRNAGCRSLDDVTLYTRDLVKRAKENALTHVDMGACSISLSNVGMLGVSTLTPIINAPNAMIIGVGAEQSLFRPDEQGNPQARTELTLTLACDHRVIDGADAGRFLVALVTILENPLRLLRGTQN